MRRPAFTVIAAGVAVATLGSAIGASAATKPKTHTLKGSYDLTLLPDPTVEATDETGTNCANINPQAADLHAVNLPGKGLLNVKLESTDPTGTALDWDLYLLDSKGNELGESTGASSDEQIIAPAKGKVTIKACNLMGAPTATVSYVYTYKK